VDGLLSIPLFGWFDVLELTVLLINIIANEVCFDWLKQ